MNLNKINRIKALIIISLLTNASLNSQNCGQSSSSPLIKKVMGITNSLGGFLLQNTNPQGAMHSSAKRIVGDWDGNGIDDLFLLERDNANLTFYFKCFLSNGDGTFTQAWSTPPTVMDLIMNNPNNKPLSVLSFTDTNGSSQYWKFVVGNFVGNTKDELLVIHPSVGGAPAFWILIENIDSSTPTVLNSVQYAAQNNGIGTNLGSAHLNGDFYAANLTGDSHDELFSLQQFPQNNPPQYPSGKAWFIHSFNNPTKTPSLVHSKLNITHIGNWFLDPSMGDELHFANFKYTNSPYDELLMIQKSWDWVMIHEFVNGDFDATSVWDNFGGTSFFTPNQCGVSNYNVTWSPNTKLFFGNWDNCDPDIECLLIDNDNLSQTASFV